MKTLAEIIVEAIDEFENYCVRQKCANCPFSARVNKSGMSCRKYILQNPMAIKVLFKDLPLDSEVNSTRRV